MCVYSEERNPKKCSDELTVVHTCPHFWYDRICMARVSYVLVPPGMTDKYKTTITPSDRFSFSSIRRKPLFGSRKRKKAVSLRSVLPAASTAWNALSPTVQENWKTAGAISKYTGFQTFIRDYASRIKNGLTGIGTANNFVQNLCLRLTVTSPASRIRLLQEHPFTYYVLRKVKGTKSQYNPVLITESFGMPITLKVRAKSTLTSAGANPSARVYLEVYSNYQGRDLTTLVNIDIPLSANWALYTATLNATIGTARGYNAYIEINNARGVLDIDNIEFNHSAQNWCRDPRCEKSATSYTRAFYQIARNWVADDMPTGSYFDSIYYEL